MKKLTAVLISILLIFSLASCSSAPSAQKLLIDAGNNTKAYSFSGQFDIGIAEAGISSSANLKINGAYDGENVSASYVLGVPQMNLTGNIYYTGEDQTTYLQIMGIWLSFDADDIGNLAETDDTESENIPQVSAQKITEETLENMGLTFSEVTEENGVYSFDIRYNKDIWNTMLREQLQAQTDSGIMVFPDGQSADEYVNAILSSLEKLKIHADISKEDLTILGFSADLMPLFESLSEYEDVPLNKCEFRLSISDVGNVQAEMPSESVTKNAISLLEYINAIADYTE